MTDGIISGAGTSRNFKVPANAKALYPTWDAALDAMIAGTFTFDLYGINPAGWDVVGDKLGKETLLTDALCSALDLPTTSTPTQAMDKLRQLVAAAQSDVSTRAKIAYGSYVPTDAQITLNLNFAPKFCFIHGVKASAPAFAFALGVGNDYSVAASRSGENNTSYVHGVGDYTRMLFYSNRIVLPSGSAVTQKSVADRYYYVAIG